MVIVWEYQQLEVNVFFAKSYNNNILVNAMCVGLKIFYSVASGKGNPIIYVGSKTGRDEYIVLLWHQQSLMKIQKAGDSSASW